MGGRTYSPLLVVETFKQRCVRGHLDHIAITLKANHEDSLGDGANQCGPPVGRASVGVRARVLPDEDAVATICVVELVEHGHELVGFEIICSSPYNISLLSVYPISISIPSYSLPISSLYIYI